MSKKDTRRKTFLFVITTPRYVLWGVVMAVILFLVLVLSISGATLSALLSSDAYSGSEKIQFLLDSPQIATAQITGASKIFVIILLLLTAINGALFARYYVMRRSLGRISGTSVLGTVIAIFGIGCGACGSVFLSLIIGTGAAVGFLGILPFSGWEFAFIGLIAILYAMHTLLKNIHKGAVCGVDDSVKK